MNRECERWLGPGEAAARLGVTAKALRVYERAGLVRPDRTAGQWRAYGPAHIARLHMILVMRELGMSLKDIGQALDGKGVSLPALLAAQQDALEQKRRKIADAIEHVRLARLRVAQGLPLSTDDFLHLSKETVMQDATMSPDAKAGLTAHLQSAVPSEHYQAMKTAVGSLIAEAGLDNLKAEAAILFAEMKRLAPEGDPASPAARAAIERWRAVTKGAAQPVPDAGEAWNKGWDKAMADPTIAPKLPVDQQTVSFIRDVVANMRTSGDPA